jgi:hypothetical protein
MKKYVLLPRRVYSKNDGQLHFISARMLISLYKVNPDDCVVYDPSMTPSFLKDKIPLPPRYDGNYDLEKL